VRGSPLLRLVLTTIALALAGIPVWSITRPSPPPPPISVAPAASATREVALTLTASEPGILSVTCLGKTLLHSETPTQSATARVFINSENPDDFVVSARWEKSPAPQALRVEITDATGSLVDQTFWGSEFIEDTVAP